MSSTSPTDPATISTLPAPDSVSPTEFFSEIHIHTVVPNDSVWVSTAGYLAYLTGEILASFPRASSVSGFAGLL